MKFYLTVLLVLVAVVSSATSRGAAPVSPVIDPDRGAYGVPFGSTEKQLIEKLGAPSGTIQLSSTRRALIYGKSHAFLFRKGSFRTFIFSQDVLDYRVSGGMEPHPTIDSVSWVLGPGIKNGMNYAQVAKALRRTDAQGDYDLNYETTNARVQLQFSGRQGGRGDPESFTLHGFVIEFEP